MPHPEPERVLVLEQWLREHGQHDDDFCGKNDWPDNDCECGLEALLASRAGVRPMTSPRQEPRDSADPEAVAGLREALRRLDDLAENQAYALNVRCVIHDIASDFRAALRDRAGVPPPPPLESYRLEDHARNQLTPLRPTFDGARGESMESYIGTKVVQAEPASRAQCQVLMKGQEDAPGYRVIYEDGYVSWSPKEVFERCYRRVTEAEAALIR